MFDKFLWKGKQIKILICNVCFFPWYKCSYHGWFLAPEVISLNVGLEQYTYTTGRSWMTILLPGPLLMVVHAYGNLKKYVNISLHPCPPTRTSLLRNKKRIFSPSSLSQSCDRNALCLQHSSGPYYVTHVRLEDKGNKYADVYADFCATSINCFVS